LRFWLGLCGLRWRLLVCSLWFAVSPLCRAVSSKLSWSRDRAPKCRVLLIGGWGLGVGGWGLGVGGWGLGVGDRGLGVGGWGLGIGVWGLGFRGWGL